MRGPKAHAGARVLLSSLSRAIWRLSRRGEQEHQTRLNQKGVPGGVPTTRRALFGLPPRVWSMMCLGPSRQAKKQVKARHWAHAWRTAGVARKYPAASTFFGLSARVELFAEKGYLQESVKQLPGILLLSHGFVLDRLRHRAQMFNGLWGSGLTERPMYIIAWCGRIRVAIGCFQAWLSIETSCVAIPRCMPLVALVRCHRPYPPFLSHGWLLWTPYSALC